METGKNPLTSTQIKKVFSGNTVAGTANASGHAYQIKFDTDGSATLSSGSFTDSGKWWVEGKDTYCVQWTTANNGAKRCLRLYDLGDKYESINSDGYANATFTVK